jgi:cell wall-associated NlpC family hydrolase
MRRPPIFLISLTLLLFCAPARSEDSVADNLRETAQPLLKALSLIGTPYKFGGSQPENGVDCSGFVRFVFKQASDITLPRTAHEMSQEGIPVDESDLQPGDLVFFKTRKQAISHVGIYAGNGEFVHASSRRSKQVTVSHLNGGYWSSRFSGARRVLPSP